MSSDVEPRIAAWRAAIQRDTRLPAENLQELEDLLRDELDGLREKGLTDDEALLVAVKRMGSTNDVARELARVDADRMWRHFFETGESAGQPASRGLFWVIGAALLAAALGKVPLLFGVSMMDTGFEVYLRNLSLFVVPILMAGYCIRNRVPLPIAVVLVTTVVASALAVNLYPFRAGGATSFLVAVHLPLLLWLGFGLAYTGEDWRTVRAPLDFIRFSGEMFLYAVLILCGGVVLVGLVVVFFTAIGIPVASFAMEYLGFSILLATPVIAAYLVENKRSLIENLAPVLAQVFIPLFLLMMVAFIGAVAVQRQNIMANRDMLITIDLLLLLVVGMVLYDLSARPESQGFSLPHVLNLALILAALVIDSIALYGIAGRLGEYGFSPNKTAALGENVLLAGNLIGLAVAYVRVALGKATFARVLEWQVRYLPVYFVWMVFMVFALPVVFKFR